MLAGYKSLNEWLMQVASDSRQHGGQSAMDVRMGGGTQSVLGVSYFLVPAGVSPNRAL